MITLDLYTPYVSIDGEIYPTELPSPALRYPLKGKNIPTLMADIDPICLAAERKLRETNSVFIIEEAVLDEHVGYGIMYSPLGE